MAVREIHRAENAEGVIRKMNNGPLSQDSGPLIFRQNPVHPKSLITSRVSRRDRSGAMAENLLFGDVWKKTDEASSENRLTNRSLIKSRSAGSATRHDATFTVNQIAQCSQVFVVHVHWTWNFTVDAELTAHLLFLETSTTFAELLQISAGNCCHERFSYP